MYEISFYFVLGQMTNKGKSDCIVLFNYLKMWF